MALEESESPNVVAVGCRQCDVQCWDVDTLQLMSSYLGHSKDVSGSFSAAIQCNLQPVSHSCHFPHLGVLCCSLGYRLFLGVWRQQHKGMHHMLLRGNANT